MKKIHIVEHKFCTEGEEYKPVLKGKNKKQLYFLFLAYYISIKIYRININIFKKKCCPPRQRLSSKQNCA